jgi:hypothetical protein
MLFKKLKTGRWFYWSHLGTGGQKNRVPVSVKYGQQVIDASDSGFVSWLEKDSSVIVCPD